MQCAFTCSNGSRQARQRSSALQAVEPVRAISSVSGEPQRGHRAAVLTSGSSRADGGSGAPARAGRCPRR